MDLDLITFCKRIPKAELHAHLNGSLSDQTISKLVELKRRQGGGDSIIDGEWWKMTNDNRSMDRFFQKFDLIYRVTSSLEAVKIATRDVISEMWADGVVYLELRTTPRAVLGEYTKQQYLEAVVDTVRGCNDDLSLGIITRLLLSIDRKVEVEQAWEVIQFAKHWPHLVVGIDLSGQAKEAQNLREFVPVLQAARQHGLKLTVHLAEMPGEDEEVLAVLKDCKPDRIGHGTFLSEDARKLILQNNIPLELCLTSNLLCGTVETLGDHHIKLWSKLNHPVLICTDDKGVFDTSLSAEFVHAAGAVGLDRTQLWRISENAVKYSFLPSQDKYQLLRMWKDRKEELSGNG